MEIHYSDIELWSRLVKGDRNAVQWIYSRYFGMLYQYGMRMLQDEDAVRDCMQNLFLTLWVSRKKIGHIENLKNYLIASFRNNIVRYRSRENRMEKVALDSSELFDLNISVENTYIVKEEQSAKYQQISEAMGKLTPRQKEIIYLKYFEELDYDQIAEIMDLTKKGAYKLSARALEALREIMNIDKSILLAILLGLKH